MKQNLFMIIQYCAILKTVTINSTYRSGLVVVGFVSLFSFWGLQTQLKPWVNNHSNNMKSTTNKSPWSQQWGKKAFTKPPQNGECRREAGPGGRQHPCENGDLGCTGRVKSSPQLPMLQH